jgi:NAD(P)-dependent dehydrogenase (short-subunit alcohol dehydrogenase family)
MATLGRSRSVIAVCTISMVACSTNPTTWTRSCKSTETASDVLAGIDLSGKIIIYTGADGNLASQSTLALAKANATLILACRTPLKCDAVRKTIQQEGGGAIEVEQLDLSSQSSIKAFVKRVSAKHPRLDVLINSAATYGTFMTHDNLVGAMEINLLGPALLTDLLLPSLRGHGRVVNVAAAAYGAELPKDITAKDLAALCTAYNATMDKTYGYYGLSKFLMVHHALEVAKREPTVAAVALAPGVAFKLPPLPDWLKHKIMHFGYPDWLVKMLPESWQHFIKACQTNEAGLASCPETQEEGAAVIVAAAAWPEVESHSGIYLDFDTKPLPPDAPNVYGPWTQSDPTCVPRQPTPMDENLRAAWYDEMLDLMTTKHTPKVNAEVVVV